MCSVSSLLYSTPELYGVLQVGIVGHVRARDYCASAVARSVNIVN